MKTVLITDRGVPVARLEPIAADPGQPGRLDRLERAGLVRRGTAAPPVDVIRRPGPALERGATLLDGLLEERRTGR
jgi:antitoxin (DNA-binding transcriptional repressor) of toxin-antitoxin stability system